MIVDLESTLHKTPRLIVEGCLVMTLNKVIRNDRKVNKADRISGTVCLILSVVVAIESFRLELGNLYSPKAGFFPFVAAIILGVLSLILILSAARQKLEVMEKGEEITFDRHGLVKVSYVIGSLFVYSILLNTLGFLLGSMLLMGFLLGVVEPQKLYIVILGGISIPIISYYIFVVALQVQMPVGFLGF